MTVPFDFDAPLVENTPEFDAAISELERLLTIETEVLTVPEMLLAFGLGVKVERLCRGDTIPGVDVRGQPPY